MADTNDINKWKGDSTKNLFIWKYFMKGYELEGWRLKEIRPWEDIKTERVVQYYWESKTDKEEQVKIDIIECHSWDHAQQQLMELLKQHMHTRLAMAGTKEIRVGDTAFIGAGDEPQHLLFARANMVTVLNSVGKKRVAVAKTALQLDNLFYDKPRPQVTGVTPVIERFSIERQERKIKEQNTARVIIGASDPLQGPLWYKLVSKRGEMISENDNLYVLLTRGEPDQLTVYVTSENGNAAEKTIDW